MEKVHWPEWALMLTSRLCGMVWVPGGQSVAARRFSGNDV